MSECTHNIGYQSTCIRCYKSAQEIIDLLEAVAEALVQQYYSNPYVTMHLAVYEALRAAGYLKEQV
jgi:hypothetical protein